MAQSRALSDDEVAGELRKMTAFIRQEALEKAKEIELKADEEFAIEKAKLVRQETAAVARAYDKKFKQAAMSQQITRSTLANRSRLRLLAARQALLDDLFERVRARLVEEVARSSSSSNGSSGGDSGDSGEGGEGGDEGDKGGDEGGEGGESGEAGGRYIGVLKNLVLQGAYALNEPRLMVQARKQDYDAVRRAIRDAEKEYGDVAGREIHIDVDEDNPLPPSSAGGVIILGSNGKIDVNNTLEERLRLLQSDALPAVRNMLFGPNLNRKFRD